MESFSVLSTPQSLLIGILEELDVSNNQGQSSCSWCLLCKSTQTLTIGAGAHKSTQDKLIRGFTQSLCQLLSCTIPEKLRKALHGASYCENCYQLVLDIQFLTNGIKAYEHRLLSLKHKTENLLYHSGLKEETIEFVDVDADFYPTSFTSVEGGDSLVPVPGPEKLINSSSPNLKKYQNPRSRFGSDDNIKSTSKVTSAAKKPKIDIEPKAQPAPEITTTRSGRRVSKRKELEIESTDDEDVSDEFMENECISDNESDVIKTIQKPQKPRPSTKLPKQKKYRSKYSCDQCSATYWKAHRLQTHIQRDHLKTKPTLKCLLCPALLWSNENLKIHYRLKHTAQDIENCETQVLDELPPVIVKLLREKPTVNPSPQFKITCSFDSECRLQFNKRFLLECHIQKDHLKVDPTVPCQLCDKKFYTDGNLREHYRRGGHTENDIGDLEISPEIVQLLRRKAEKKEVKGKDFSIPKQIFTCELCEKTLQTRKGLKYHIESVHAENLNKLNCSTCGKMYNSPEEVSQHEELHQLQLINQRHPWTCVFCTKNIELYQTKAELQKHVLSIHEPDVFRCSECPKVVLTQVKLQQHIKQFHTQPGILCELCGYTAYSSSRLREHHKLIHTLDKPFICQVEGCESTFKESRYLTKHIQIVHEKDHRHICNICSKVFSSNQNLQKHSIYHLEVRPFVCEICSSAHKTMKDLTVHMKIHEKNPGKHFKVRKQINRLPKWHSQFGLEEEQVVNPAVPAEIKRIKIRKRKKK